MMHMWQHLEYCIPVMTYLAENINISKSIQQKYSKALSNVLTWLVGCKT